MEALGKLALFLILIAIGSLASAFTALMLWIWFIIPLGAPEISGWHAWGLSIAVTWATHSVTAKKGDADPGTQLVDGLILNVVTLAIAGLAYWGMP